MASDFLTRYRALDVIGSGSFGIIRKVCRRSDGLIFALKELNFTRMSTKDRKQVVAEVNILKELQHRNIVRYHDRYVDDSSETLYILMEYCGGGDLSNIIKQAVKQKRHIPEATVWRYLREILSALNYCHNTDLKPENVFLDEANTVKLGDFGLSKALVHAEFATTYSGTPIYMSPELVRGIAYNSKSDIWSLGCVIYELCCLKPLFGGARTHSELSSWIWSLRMPQLPGRYSQTLHDVIESMLSLNPEMRPSARQLLQQGSLEVVFKLLDTIKYHEVNLQSRERDKTALNKTNSELAKRIQQKTAEIESLHKQYQSQLQTQYDEAREATNLQISGLLQRKEAEIILIHENHRSQLMTQYQMGQEA
ncbi:kinase-like domain-containing protein, partial [Mycena olivaceomarginata]